MNIRILTTLLLSLTAPVLTRAADPHLKLYASFDQGPKPEIARDGAGLKKAANLKLTDGKKGKAIAVSADDAKLLDLVYSLGDAVAGPEWTVAMWLRNDAKDKPVGCVFRTFSTGEWGKGDITATFSKWGEFNFSRFDGRRREQSCRIAAAAAPRGVWTHFAWTSQNGHARIYVNGYEANYKSNADVAEPADRQTGLRLGCSSPQKPYYFNHGAIDELKVYNRALDAAAIRGIMNDTTGAAPAPQPVLYLPFEGKVDPVCAEGTVGASSDRLIFQPAVIGQGAAFVRYGYDARSAMSITDVPGIAGPAMTADFFFIPNWNGGDGAVHGLLHATTPGFAWLLRVKNNELEFVLSAGGREQRLAVPTGNWRKNVPLHLAAGYSVAAKKMFLAIDGKIAAAGPFTLAPSGRKASLVVGDYADCDMYRKSQAEGVIDELRLFAAALDPEQLRAEIARRTQVKVASGNRQDAPLASRPVTPAEAKLWDLSGAYRENTSARQKICLNALWRFQLTAEGKTPRAEQWRYLAVPGRYSGQENGNSDHHFLVRDAKLKPGDQRQLWQGEPTYKFFNSWFERAFKVDPAWLKRQVVLRFDELSNTSSATVYLNGKYLAELDGAHAYEIPVDPARLKTDADNFILIHLFDSGNRWSWRGIKDNVWLEVRPDTVIAQPQVVTSVTDRRLSLGAQIANHSDRPRKVRLEAVITGDRAPTRLVGRELTLPSGGRGQVELSTAWDNPRQWDYEHPYLYRCRLRLLDEQGKELDAAPEFRFGFREFRIIGSDYYLNGRKVHLRNHDTWMNSSGDYEQCRAYIRLLKEIGYNSVRGNFDDKDVNMPNILRACDEEGMMLFINLIGVTRKEYSAWSNPRTRVELEKKMASRIIDWRNHPSIVMWYMSVNFLGYGWDYHPLKMADGYLPKFKMNQFKICSEATRFLDRYDPTRPYFLQAGGAFGPVINSNAYFCWWPQAEKNAWVREWSKKPTKPLHIIETSFPYNKSFFGMDLRFSAGKPLFVVENAARYFGETAYTDVEQELRRLMLESRTGKADYLKWAFISADRDLALVSRLKSRMLVETILNWRADGISGICPFEELRYAFRRKCTSNWIHDAYSQPRKIADFRQPGWHSDLAKRAPFMDIDTDRPLPYLQALKQALNPTLVFVAGTESDPSSQVHSFYAGEKITRSLVAINDTLEPRRFTARWQLRDAAGNPVGEGQFDRELAPAEIVRTPLPLSAPQVNAKTSYRLTVDVSAPAGIKVDPVDLTVFPRRPQLHPGGKIAVYDPRGLSAASLRDIGAKFADAARLDRLDGCTLLIVGREGFGPEFADWARKVGLDSWLESGRGNVLMLEQQQNALRMMELESNAVYARDVFLPEAGLPQLAGLDSADLSNWQGSGTLAPQHQSPPATTEETVASPLWHWSNLNLVSSYPIRRPSAGRYRNLVVCGKDLAYTPLLEIACKRGQLVLCQMEVSGRAATEPAAAFLLAGLINHYSQPRPTEFRPAQLRSDRNADPQFSRLGFELSSESDAIRPETVVAVNRQLAPGELERLAQAARTGATIILAHHDPAAFAALGVKTEPGTLWTFTVTAAGQSVLGTLSARDRFFRYPVKTPLLSGPGLRPLTAPAFAAELPAGKGRFLLIPLDYRPQQKYFDQALKINLASSNLWAESQLRERYLNLWCRLLSNLGVPAQSLARRLTQPVLPPARLDLSGTWEFRTDPAEIGLKQHWEQPAAFARTSGWGKLQVPGYWETQGINQRNPNLPVTAQTRGYDGYAWYRKTITVPPQLRGKPLLFHADAIDDFDQVFVNGVEIGRTGEETEGYWNAPRNYPIPDALLKNQVIHLAIRVCDARGQGGVCGEVKLQERTASAGVSAFPYYARPLPGYDTETAIRW